MIATTNNKNERYKRTLLSQRASSTNKNLFRVQRKFETDRPIEARTFVNRMGQAPDLEYVLDYEYE